MKRGVVPFLLLFLLNLIVWTDVFHFSRAAPLEVVFLDVGEGAATLVKIGPLYQVLVDGGPGKKILEEASSEMPLGDRRIDLVVLTHPEKDHLGGVVQVLERYEVDHVLWNGTKGEGALFRAWKDLLKNTDQRIGWKGGKVEAGQAELEILLPEENLEGARPKSLNNASMVMKLNFGQTPFLFTGDIYASQEEKLNKGVRSEVLQVPHHGSKTSSSRHLLSSVLPQIGVIQTGEDNSYGHPHQEVVDRLRETGIRIMRTDQGEVKILSDGVNLVVNKH